MATQGRLDTQRWPAGCLPRQGLLAMLTVCPGSHQPQNDQRMHLAGFGGLNCKGNLVALFRTPHSHTCPQETGMPLTAGVHLSLWLTMAASTFNSLSRVLFTIRSLYLFTIGHAIIFSLDRHTAAKIELQYQEALLIGHQPGGI